MRSFTNWRVEYVAPTQPGHDFEPYCAILADLEKYGTCRVFDVPDPDEGQRAIAQEVCDAMNARAASPVGDRRGCGMSDVTLTDAEKDALLRAVMRRVYKDIPPVKCNCAFHRLSEAERIKVIDAAIDATNAQIVDGHLPEGNSNE